MDRADGDRRCMRCGEMEATWLVTYPYDNIAGPGRLLAYCDGCRTEARLGTWLAMPIALLDVDADKVMISLYEHKLVGTNPRCWRTRLDSRDLG